jgi:hypothetical protein
MSSRRLGRRMVAAVVCSVAAGSVFAATPAAAANGNAILDLPVAFEVTNTNDSGVACPSDGDAYTVRGRLVGPRSALERQGRRVVTVYLHGFNVGAFMWHPPGFPELDLPAALARRGHVSLTVDRLGYDTSGHPHGLLSCFGSAADVAHQLAGKLRSGDYAVSGASPPTFSRVVLAGHDSGAAIADIVAYSYKDIDAIVHFNWAEQGFTQETRVGFAEAASVCASGGQAAEQGPPDRDDPAGGPSGYVQFLTDAQIRSKQFNTEPDVVDRLLRLVNRNPCGEFTQAPQVAQTNIQRLPEIRIPVLYGYTDHEFVWTQEGLAQQADHYRNSSDLTTVVIRNAGHFPQFARVARVFHASIAEWLRSRRLVSTGARTADGCPAANRTIAGHRHADRLRGTARPDNVVGRGGGDRLSARGANDCVLGSAGDDWLRGGAGSDFASGGSGDDRIDIADGERDRVDCGPGRDRALADKVDALRRCESVRTTPDRADRRQRR